MHEQNGRQARRSECRRIAFAPAGLNSIRNTKPARLAKLAGAPDDKAAGVHLNVAVGDAVASGQPLCTVHAEAPGELPYAFHYASMNRDIIAIGEP